VVHHPVRLATMYGGLNRARKTMTRQMSLDDVKQDLDNQESAQALAKANSTPAKANSTPAVNQEIEANSTPAFFVKEEDMMPDEFSAILSTPFLDFPPQNDDLHNDEQDDSFLQPSDETQTSAQTLHFYKQRLQEVEKELETKTQALETQTQASKELEEKLKTKTKASERKMSGIGKKRNEPEQSITKNENAGIKSKKPRKERKGYIENIFGSVVDIVVKAQYIVPLFNLLAWSFVDQNAMDTFYKRLYSTEAFETSHKNKKKNSKVLSSQMACWFFMRALGYLEMRNPDNFLHGKKNNLQYQWNVWAAITSSYKFCKMINTIKPSLFLKQDDHHDDECSYIVTQQMQIKMQAMSLLKQHNVDFANIDQLFGTKKQEISTDAIQVIYVLNSKLSLSIS